MRLAALVLAAATSAALAEEPAAPPTQAPAAAPTAEATAAEQAAYARILAAARAADRVWQDQLARQFVRLAATAAAERVEAMRALADMGDRVAIPRLMPFLEGQRTPEEIAAASLALLDLQAKNAMELIRRHTAHPDAQVRLTTLHVLDRLGSTSDWRARLKDGDPEIRTLATQHESIIGPVEAAAVLGEGLRRDRNALTRRLCAWGLGRLGATTQADALIEGLTDPDLMVRRMCAQSLVIMRHRPAIPTLIRVLEISNDYGIFAALASMAKQDFGYRPSDPPHRRLEAIARADRWWGEAMTAKE